MARYTESHGTKVDYDLDSKDPFKEDRYERFYDERNRQDRNRFQDEDGDWDDADYE